MANVEPLTPANMSSSAASASTSLQGGFLATSLQRAVEMQMQNASSAESASAKTAPVAGSTSKPASVAGSTPKAQQGQGKAVARASYKNQNLLIWYTRWYRLFLKSFFYHCDKDTIDDSSRTMIKKTALTI